LKVGILYNSMCIAVLSVR